MKPELKAEILSGLAKSLDHTKNCFTVDTALNDFPPVTFVNYVNLTGKILNKFS